MNKKYFKKIDIIRLLSCIAVLFYHLNILKGGYLAVCVFFVLTGYLSCISSFKKKKFSILNYYKSRILHIYLPLLIVVLLSIFTLSFFKDISWLNLKPETKSVLLGYNNFWQINANLDYFARHIDSPFMHFWYIGILFQFELIFPFIFILFKKMGDKIHRSIPVLLSIILSIIGASYFFIMAKGDNITMVYYSTFTRIFSIFFGLSLGFIHCYYKHIIIKPFRKKGISNFIFYTYLIILTVLFFTINASSKYYSIAMIASSLITVRMLEYSTLRITQIPNSMDKLVNKLSSISYEIYLVQYPIIFIFQSINIPGFIKLPGTLVLVLITSYLVHKATSFKFKGVLSTIYTIFIMILVFIPTILGGYKFITAKDYSTDMKELEDQLSKNKKEMEEKQRKYEESLKEKQKEYEDMMKNLDKGEEELKEMIYKLPVVGIGDSVMLGASDELYKTFPNGYFDAAVSRTDWMANDILKDLVNKNMLGDIIIFNFGTNGDCKDACKQDILNTIGDRQLYWITVTNDKDVNVNTRYRKLAETHENVHVIEWEKAAKGHPEYFVADGIHLTPTGVKAYIETIYNALYEEYSKEFKQKREEYLKKQEEEQKNNITIIGSNIILNAYDNFNKEFTNSNFIVKEDYTFDFIEQSIKDEITKNPINHKILYVLDKELTTEEYNKIISLSKTNYIYILLLTKSNIVLNNKINNIEFYNEVNNHPEYLLSDGKHLSSSGNDRVIQIIKEQ